MVPLRLERFSLSRSPLARVRGLQAFVLPAVSSPVPFLAAVVAARLFVFLAIWIVPPVAICRPGASCCTLHGIWACVFCNVRLGIS